MGRLGVNRPSGEAAGETSRFLQTPSTGPLRGQAAARRPGYDVFAPFYDAVQGDRAQHARYIRSLIRKHAPRARTVLELACGTGSILKQLWTHYEVTGLDLSEQMLEIAAEKVPGVPLFRGDMTSFDLGEQFEVVLCVYDSINHLLRFDEWKQVFERAHAHLQDGGLFIFDINTQRKLADFASRPSTAEWFGDGNLMVVEISSLGRGVANWGVRVFERVRDSEYRFHSEDLPEISFPPERIKKALEKWFSRVWIYDAQRSRPTARSERLHFVCRS